MRLIDADAFEKFIEEKYKYGEGTDDIKDQMLFDLSYQPTAFDAEKFVKQLEEEEEYSYADFEEYAESYGLDLSEHDDWYYQGLKRAITLAKRGIVK